MSDELEKIHVVPSCNASQFQALVKIRVENGYHVISSDCKIVHDKNTFDICTVYTAIMELT